jgi:hypothetical protein
MWAVTLQVQEGGARIQTDFVILQAYPVAKDRQVPVRAGSS